MNIRTTRNTKTSLATLAGIALATVALSSCAAGLQEAGDEDPSAGSSMSSTGGPESESTEGPSGSETSAPPDPLDLPTIPGMPEVDTDNFYIINVPADLEEDCAGRDVLIQGTGVADDDKDVELSGECGLVYVTGTNIDVELGTVGSLAIVGSDNQIEVQTTPSIAVSGANNDIEYQSGTPQVSDLGTGNNVHRDS